MCEIFAVCDGGVNAVSTLKFSSKNILIQCHEKALSSQRAIKINKYHHHLMTLKSHFRREGEPTPGVF